MMLLLFPVTAHAATYAVSKSGRDSTPCGSGPRQTINAGIACLQSGDTLVIGSGTYAEILSDARTASTTPIPHGTTLQAAQGARVVLRPTVEYPGGGGVITLGDTARGITLRGLSVDAQQRHTFGVLLNGHQLRYEQAEVTGARGAGVSSTRGSQTILRSLRVHHNGTDPRKHHGMYVCGTDKVIEQNVVHDNAAYGIQVSCETGGIRRAIVRGNLVYHNTQRGIQIQGHDNVVEHNTLKDNGIGIGIGGGSGTVVQHNTITGFRPLPDNYAILSQTSAVTIRNNHLSGQRGSAGYIAWTSGQPTLAGNRCDRDGTGCQSVGSAGSEVGARPVQASPLPATIETGVPAPPDTVVVPVPPPAPARVEA